MPHRRGDDYPGRTQVQFVGPSWLNYRLRRAALAAGFPSTATYLQFRMMEAIAADLPGEYDLGEMVAQIPRRRFYFPDRTDTPIPMGRLEEYIEAAQGG